MKRMLSIRVLIAVLLGLSLTLFLAGCGCENDEESRATLNDDDDDDDDADDDSDDDDDDTDDDDNDDDDTGDDPWANIESPEDEDTLYTDDVEVLIEFGNGTLTVYLDDEDITSLLEISKGQATGTIETVPEGFHRLKAECEGNGRTFTDLIGFYVDIGEPHIDLELDAYEVLTGGTVTADWTVWDEYGNDVTSQVTVTLSVDPFLNVEINDNEVTFNADGFFKVMASTMWQGEQIDDSEWVVVSNDAIGSVELDLSDYEIDAGDTVVATVTIRNPAGDVIIADYVLTVSPAIGSTVNGNLITLTKAGVITVRATAEGSTVYDEKDVIVHALDPLWLDLILPISIVKTGEKVAPVVIAQDAYGNPAEQDWTLSTNPTEGAVIQGHILYFTAPRFYWITATMVLDDGDTTLQDTEGITVLDTNPPTIEFTNPPRGYWSDESELVLEGYVTDDSGIIEEFVIKDPQGVERNVSIGAGGYFSHTVYMIPGTNTYQAIARDANGNSVYAAASALYLPDYWAIGEDLTGTMGARVNDMGFDSLEEMAKQLIAENIDLKQLIMDMNPIFDETYEIWGWEYAAARVEVTDVRYEPIWVNINCFINSLLIEGHLPKLKIDVHATGHAFGIPISIRGQVKADDIAGTIVTNPEVENGQIQINFDYFEVNFVNLVFDIENFPDLLEDLFWSAVRGILEDVAEDVLWDVVPPIIEQYLDDLHIDQDIEVLGKTFNIQMDPESLTLDNYGMDVWLAGQMTPVTDKAVPPMPGSLKTYAEPPILGEFIPGTSNPYGFAAIIEDDFINHVLFSIYRSGLMDLTIDNEMAQQWGFPFELRTSTLAVLLPEIIQIDPDAPVYFKLHPMLPPTFSIGQTDDFEFAMRLGDYIFEIWVDVNETPTNPNDDVKAIGMALALKVPIEIAIKYPDNTLSLTFLTPDVMVDIYDEPVVNFSDPLFEVFVPYVVQLFLPIISAPLQNIELPAFEGFSYQLHTVWALGAPTDYLVLFADLIPSQSDKIEERMNVIAQEIQAKR